MEITGSSVDLRTAKRVGQIITATASLLRGSWRPQRSRLGERATQRCSIRGWYHFQYHWKESVMAITASEARRSLFPLIEQVNDDRTAIEITSKRGNAVLMSADDYAAWQETAYLFRSPVNARRLLDAADEAARGVAVERALDRG
ncbi:hypothetical protein GCM10023147_35800 [Tsukamurella soli]|uniref:Antitoxin n=2 Tax=Tsukamurella soli TaxID=644556 RepID=A0ABP8K186_9ACTN